MLTQYIKKKKKDRTFSLFGELGRTRFLPPVFITPVAPDLILGNTDLSCQEQELRKGKPHPAIVAILVPDDQSSTPNPGNDLDSK